MKTLIKQLTLLILLTGSGAMAFAQSVTADSTKKFDKRSFRTWSIGLHGGILTHYTPFNNTRNGDFKTAESEWGYGGYIKKQILPGFGVQADFLAGEVKGKRSNALPDNTSAQDSSHYRTHIDYSVSVSANFTVANLSFNHKHSFISPYFTGGAGYMSYAAKVTSTPAGASTNFKQNWFIPIGAGIKFNLAKAINLDFGYTVYFMKTNNFDGVASNINDKFSYGHAGIEIALGRKNASQLQNYSAIAALREANQAESIAIRNKLAALEAQHQADEQQRLADQAQYARDMADDDADGVANKFDKCAGTAAGTVVDGSGCPLKTPAAIVVENKVTERIIVTEEDRKIVADAIRNLEFETGKANIKASSYASLDKVAELLTSKNFTIKLAGHTDNVGSATSNMKLSKDRAESVKAYLVSKGANPSRVEATGYGEDQPIESNKTAEGRQKNRRVEFTIF